MHTGLARRSLGWRDGIAILAVAAVGAASAATASHEEHAADRDCAICELRHEPAELSASPQTGLSNAAEPFDPQPATGWIASRRFSRIPARAPPA